MPRAPSLCPKCGERPRRAPGLSCTPCNSAWQKARRDRGEAGTAQRVTETPTFDRELRGQRFLITSAQNATPVHAPFFDTLERAAKHLGAELVVVPLRYKNPTSIWSSKNERDDWWDDRVSPYLVNTRKRLGPHLVLVGDVKVQPTASKPLSGFEALTGKESCIIAHPKMQLRMVPSPMGRTPKLLTTTGSCTKPNTTDTKAGKLGAFHHFLGAIVVEVDGPRFWVRQLNADRDTGEFIDLNKHFTRDGVKRAPRALGLVMGDTHARHTCPRVDAATFGEGGIVDTLDPEVLVWHDLFDGYAVNPHHAGNPFIARAKYASGLGDVRAEVEHAVQHVVDRTKGRKSVIVASNHDDFLMRWVVNADWKSNPLNAPFYLQTALAVLNSARMTRGGAQYANPFGYWVEMLRGSAQIRALKVDESFKLGDVEVSLHGDRGPNGARGTLRNLSRIGARVFIGHSHTPGIEEGCYQVGTSTPLRLEYNAGPSSWFNAHGVTYANGKRALLMIVDGEWRAPRERKARAA